MVKIEKISGFLSRYIGVVILVFSAAAFWQPEAFAWTADYTAVFLGIAMFGMGLAIRPEDFKVVLGRPWEIVVGCIVQYTVMPVSAWVLAKVLHLPEDLVVGVILVGCCPGGTASNVITYIAGGDVALSVGMTTVSTLLAPLMTPLLVYVLAGTWVEVSLLSMMLSVVKIVLVPVLAGLIIRACLGKQVEKLSGVLPLVSVTAIVMIISGIVAKNTQQILTCGLLVLGIVMLHNLLGLLLGLLAAKAFRMDYRKATAVAIEVGMQNSGLAVSLAAANFAANPLATLPGAVFSVWHNISGSVFAGIRQNGAGKVEEGNG